MRSGRADIIYFSALVMTEKHERVLSEHDICKTIVNPKSTHINVKVKYDKPIGQREHNCLEQCGLRNFKQPKAYPLVL